jgi:hypothetical protein
MPVALRCADVKTALESLAMLHGVSANAVLDALPRAVAVGVTDVDHPVRAVAGALARSLGTTCGEPCAIHYFHGTRTADPSRFAAEGLLPLNAVLEDIWLGIGALGPEVTDADLRALRDDLEHGRVAPHTYQLRASDDRQHGPYGNLVQEVLLYPDDYGSVDYLAGAEIAVDICEAASGRFGIDLAPRFHAATVPCVVEFAMPAEDVEGAMASAIWYLDSAVRGERTTNAHWAYDGEGRPVEPENVVSVEVVG